MINATGVIILHISPPIVAYKSWTRSGPLSDRLTSRQAVQVTLASLVQSAVMCLQDVDQRMTRDVVRLCDDLAALIPNLVKPIVDLLWFSAQLSQLTGRRGLAILYLYAVAGFFTLK